MRIANADCGLTAGNVRPIRNPQSAIATPMVYVLSGMVMTIIVVLAAVGWGNSYQNINSKRGRDPAKIM